jgi:phosphatidylserine/phosphatidylglycerophosphate/cardiolipin synthase-like enzyme
VKLIVQPDDGLTPLMKAVQHSKTSIDLVIFRFDRVDLEKALAAAVARGVVVRVLIAYTNGGGEKLLRKLEPRLLAAGVTVSRTADDLPRYHGKMTIIDDALFVLGFNYTRQDIERSRSFGLITHDKKLIKEATSLFEADSTRQPYNPGNDRFVVSPETSRERLTAVIEKTRKQLLIYNDNISDKLMLRLIRERAADGVEIRVIGKLAKNIPGITTRKLSDLRLHVRALISDGATAFIGSQGLRKPEMDERREIGLIVKDSRIARRMRDVFEADWALTKGPKNEAAGENDSDVTEKEAAAG